MSLEVPVRFRVAFLGTFSLSPFSFLFFFASEQKSSSHLVSVSEGVK